MMKRIKQWLRERAETKAQARQIERNLTNDDMFTVIRSNERGSIEMVIVAVIAGFVILAIASTFIWSTNHHQVSFKVNKTERVVDKDGKGARYLVYTDSGVYQNTDSIWNGKFNSSDLYSQIQAGKSYTCDAVGFRNGFLSAYENLVSCTETK